MTRISGRHLKEYVAVIPVVMADGKRMQDVRDGVTKQRTEMRVSLLPWSER